MKREREEEGGERESEREREREMNTDRSVAYNERGVVDFRSRNEMYLKMKQMKWTV